MYREDGSGSFLYEDEYAEAVDEIFGMLDNDDTLSVDDLKYMLETYFPCLTRKDFERIYLDYYELRKEDEDYGMQIARG